MSRVVIIGAGHNGLTAAFYLARAGLKPLVLERRPIVGGAATTEEIAPGFRAPSLAHAIGPLRSSVVRDMRLESRGIEFIRPDPRLVALDAAGTSLVFSIDHGRTAEAIRRFSSHDAEAYVEFCDALSRLCRFLTPLLAATPPSLDTPDRSDMWEMVKAGVRFRGLGKKDGYRLLRWGPMAVADLVCEWFETDLLRAAIAARGIFGSAQGPRSAGTAALMLLHAASDPAPGGSSVTVKGGPGALTAAMADAAREAGAEIRVNSSVSRVLVRDGRAAAVVLESGSEITTTAVISNADPRHTLLALLDPLDLDPVFLSRVRNYRSRGTMAKVNLALGALPTFTGVTSHEMCGRLHVGRDIDYLERAFDASKYGEISAEPYLDVAVPTLSDPSLAAERGKHVLSACVQFVPHRLVGGHTGPAAKSVILSHVMRTLDGCAPGIESLVEHAQVLSPMDLEETYGLTGGHISHGEQSLDQLFTMRPVLGWARYRTPIPGLYLCGAGTHPGAGITGGSGQNAARVILTELKS